MAVSVHETEKVGIIISPWELDSFLTKELYSFLVNEEKEKVFKSLKSQKTLPKELVLEVLVPTACHELRHKLVLRGLVTPFDFDSIQKLSSLLDPPESGQDLVQFFEKLAKETKSVLEVDARVIELMVFNQARDMEDFKEEDLKELLPILLLNADTFINPE